jgi:hypothetical protein
MTDLESPNAAPVQAPPIVAGRACGDCMLCCKLFAIAALDKPMGKWCVHASPGRGCGIYADRPGECRAFHCGWLLDPTLGPEWKPDRAKFFISQQPSGNISIMVDAGSPGAWRAAPYYPVIKTLAARLADHGLNLFVSVGRRTIVVLPDGDRDMGVIPDGHLVRVRQSIVDGRRSFETRIEVGAVPNAVASGS